MVQDKVTSLEEEVPPTYTSPAWGEEILGRLEKLEKANRRITGVALALGAGFILMFALAATKPAPAVPDVIRAKKLEIVDEKGKARVTIEVDPKDGPQLVMYDEKGHQRAWLVLLPEGPNLALYDKNGRASAWLRAEADGPALFLSNENGLVRAGVSGASVGPFLTLFDKDGKTVIWQAPP